ncbi:sensor histidine kinase [Paenibacillus hamazuiensis]|uniref:sensor histidine kinase n=1 Tax=Paenibacillus hamazuiensis TaxID=2936508 RepID=UPI00200BDE9D|nr:HAMP domain-containing sensor histidine kinase [Paenibacillus hamazuiensis]
MNFTLRVALQLLLAFFLLFIGIHIFIFAAAWLIEPQSIVNRGSDGNGSGTLEIYVLAAFAVMFILTLLIIGWYLGKPIYFIMIWIKHLANGHYDVPMRRNQILSHKTGMLKFPYAIYKELFEHVRMLAGTLQKNEKELQASERAKREWIRGISHDLKTPLTYITGYSAMLINNEYRWSETERKEFLTVIHQKAAHLQELVQDLNETIQGQIPLKLEVADIVELVRRAVADVGSAPWANGYLLTMEAKPERVSLSCDPKLLARAIRNLLVNAVVHNPEGTRITVGVTMLHDGTVEIRINDDGIGFSKTNVPGSETTDSFGRSGLGLSIAGQLIEAHGGKLIVSSNPGEGTTLTIQLLSTQS